MYFYLLDNWMALDLGIRLKVATFYLSKKEKKKKEKKKVGYLLA
jgi:hypothetical protein